MKFLVLLISFWGIYFLLGSEAQAHSFASRTQGLSCHTLHSSNEEISTDFHLHWKRDPVFFCGLLPTPFRAGHFSFAGTPGKSAGFLFHLKPFVIHTGLSPPFFRS